MNYTTIFTLFMLLLSGCIGVQQSTRLDPNVENSTTQAANQIPDCSPAPIVVPTLPAEVPGYTEVDPATGLHMTGGPEIVDFPSYRLRVSGLVENTLSLTYDEIRCLPKVTADPVLNCPGYFTDHATWSGVPLYVILQKANPRSDAKEVTLISSDGYKADVYLDEALKKENFLAYELEGQPLPIIHGFPLRAVFPGMYGSTWVKWLVAIEVK
jgi:DMSO/TMAO reductase YedYZ molybdopterin-dependent catalytic subunit